MKLLSVIVCLLCVSIFVTLTSTADAQTVTSLRVMSYNVFVGGAAYGPLSRTVGVIQAAQADVIGLQEIGGSAASIASSLGFYYYGFNSDTAIISRYPIAEVLNQGVRLQLSPGQDAYIFNVHLAAYPYQPYDIRDGLITTEAQAIAAANSARGGSTSALLNQMTPALGSGSPVFLTGDFNEPSHLDWTQTAASAGLHFGKKVDWPTSHAIANAGMSDSYRVLRPNVITQPGNTWTPGSPAPNQDANEVFDRIDFVYYSGPNVNPTSVQTLGYNASDGSTDIAIQPYPSDHRAVVTQFSLPACSIADLSGNCHVGVEDWVQFRGGQQVNMTGLTHAQAYALGDLNGDFRNDHADFVTFKSAFDAANGAGAFLDMLAVPEPTAPLLLASALFGLTLSVRKRHHCRR
jgi:exodeoxyribonuclease-3